LVENYLKELFGADDCPFSNGICNINIKQSLEEIFGENPIRVEDAMYTLQDPEYLQDQGLALMLTNQKELILKSEVIDSIFHALTNMVLS
jgi:hypothetical protein